MDLMLDHSHLCAGSSIIRGASVEERSQCKHEVLRGQASTIPPKKRTYFLDAYFPTPEAAEAGTGTLLEIAARQTKRCTKPRSASNRTRRRPRTDCQILVVFSARRPETLAIVPVTRDHLAIVNPGDVGQQEVEEDGDRTIVAVGTAVGEQAADAATDRAAVSMIGAGEGGVVDDEDDDLYSRVKRRKRRTVRELESSRMNSNERSCTQLRRIDYSLSDSHLQKSNGIKLLEPPASTSGSSSSRRGRRTSVRTPAESASPSGMGWGRGRSTANSTAAASGSSSRRGRRKQKYLSMENILARAPRVPVPPAATAEPTVSALSARPLSILPLDHPLPLSVRPPGGAPQRW